ncbi:hypothetical protein UFOVP1040_49 [uncultured Caudovirales phage]|uniref:Uncharacterized protein n=1 Tax=uncultured Caudovirales phage TaxID=2100421 RepID=A0A6J5Q8N9_9CAUD|nr:hypothetical protein UFOVP1040_49 [uncultured Caudovirales phage]
MTDTTNAAPNAIRPAIETLRELDNGMFLDKLALAIHNATDGVTSLNKRATITIALEFAPLTKTPMVEPVITVEAEITQKLPKPDGHRAMFFVDAGGNPTTKQQKQEKLDLHIAGSSEVNAAEAGGK